nr:uncharacterized protein LOC109423736 [Aedes albopictus]
MQIFSIYDIITAFFSRTTANVCVSANQTARIDLNTSEEEVHHVSSDPNEQEEEKSSGSQQQVKSDPDEVIPLPLVCLEENDDGTNKRLVQPKKGTPFGIESVDWRSERRVSLSRTIQTSSRSQPLRAAIHVNSKHWRFLEEAKRTLETIQFVPADCFDPETASDTAKERLTATQRKPPCINGYIQNINAIGVLWKIVHEQHDFSLLRTNKVCNDPLENEFGKIRRACGTNDAPNAHQFAAALKYSCIEKTLCSDYGTNCIPDEMSNLIEEQNIDESIEIDPLAIDESFLIRQFEPLEEDSGFLPDLLEVNALVYIVGFGVTKLKHKTCKDNWYAAPTNAQTPITLFVSSSST